MKLIKTRILSISLMLVCIAIVTTACKKEDIQIKEFKVYAAPEGVDVSSIYIVEVEGQNVPVYKTKVATDSPIPRLNHSRSKFGYASLASFDIGKDEVELSVTYSETIKDVKILPSSLEIDARIEDNKVFFTVNKPSALTIEFNGDWHESLHVFANPMETNIPDPKDPKVMYFGPGLHEVTHIKIPENTTVYIAGGAYIKAIVDAEEQPIEKMISQNLTPPTFFMEGENITIRGRGIIDQAAIPKKKRRYTIFAQHSKNINIEGVTILDPSHWTIPLQATDDIHVDNIKILGWRGNSDGVDISNSRNALVENCFMRTLDDAVVIKSFKGKGEVKNIHTRKCVIWNELAHSLSIGAEIQENVTNVIFEDCDVIHDKGRETALRVYHCDDALISDVIFRDIRIEEARRLISCWIGKTRWTESEERGNVRNVIFKDIVATSAPIDTTLTGFQDGTDWKPYIIKDHASMQLIGFDDTHTIEGVTFENVILDGNKVKANQVITNDFVKGVRFN
ncbi:glycosyl hydrolase family 28 protein [Polaribacter sargassicola]|uniref:glycosyl hydrolase family 28 protein n=1 Tax=Polaribacter sargassicola TaxID=2836891 RepID=UPI001EFFF49F|nr:glycosyl hydrolase family 28 protein [Polaribacter sp. DS7-9]MCG1037434.1 hypothetical protein [Polaribacter sp. DS7-9]